MSVPDVNRHAEIAERAEKASLGPWSYSWTEVPSRLSSVGTMHCVNGPIPDAPDSVMGMMIHASTERGNKWDADNANFIAHARADVPWLLAELSRAHERAGTLIADLAMFTTALLLTGTLLNEIGQWFIDEQPDVPDALTTRIIELSKHVSDVLAVSPSAEPARCPDCWRPAGRHASDCPSLPIVCRCGQPLTEVHTVTTGVCPTHGVQHAPPAEAGQDKR